MLCACCKRVFDQPAAHGEDGTWASRAEWTLRLAIIKKSSLSCVACHAMARVLKTFVQWDEDEGLILKFAGSLYSAALRHGTLSYAYYNVRDTRKMSISSSIVLLVEQIKGQGSLDLISRAESTSTNSPDTFAFIKECMQKCQTNHKICRAAATQPPWYPTRLIQVEDSQARLIITRDTPPQGPYATLSHCWGGCSDVTQCTSNNLEELKNGIELASLPANFRDAIHATRALGIAYIWIDSLCIMQDSDADKTVEIKTMFNVYRQSVLTLAATRAVDSHAGLFAPRSPENLSAGPFRISNGILDGMFVAVEAAADTRWHWDDVVEYAPLNLRGWVLQERFLSPRIVHFTDDQAIWDCAESTAAEFVPSGAQALPWMKTAGIGPKRSSRILVISPEKDQAPGQWFQIVDSYSRYQLSRASDKLLALSGVVDSLRSVLGADSGEGGYYVGLWRFQMEIQLCWRTERLQGGALPTRNQFAPSWSWMSVDGAVTTSHLRRHRENGYDVQLLAQVISVDMDEPEDNGSRQHGRLRLRCILSAVELGAESLFTIRGATMEKRPIVDLDSADAADTAGPLFFAPVFGVGHAPKHRLGPYPPLAVRGLLLKLVGDEETGIYSRRGLVLTGVTQDLYYSGKFSDSYFGMLPAGVRLGQPASADIFAGGGRVITIQ
ncbi:hypothetical protein MAPG_03521 [Magnaporthiopsis poae ATCC 64411]|uniref:Heterokaryon incompatibility domain-containing protein n=1 Tax=Magnaporthiopsis poae (strain ATCC 64411 / 73-15) TaxID=644358 RepID=A0A0C4DU83_MAGP6|nr:hypothetical protein MAPG_03521 [Magnaporthiopsis poae ATCC 64411]